MQTHDSLKQNNTRIDWLEVLFISFCLMPFIIPNPIVGTNIQPYSAMLGTLIILRSRILRMQRYSFEVVAILTFVLAVIVMLIGGIDIAAFRAIYNYFAVMIVPWATIVTIRRIGYFPEKVVKALILIWVAVATVQFFVYRGFATQIIGGVKWSADYRGVVGLASEPSFLGIACFYFLHMVSRFESKKSLYMTIVLITAVLYAQSAIGILFVVVYLAVLLLEETRGTKGVLIWLVAVMLVILFFYLIETAMVGSRLHSLFHDFIEGGTTEVTEDESVNNRIHAITVALQDAFGNYLLPHGFGKRIGSGYGGFLVELGFFAFPVMICISRAMSLTFRRKLSQVVYFVGVTVLLFNNTQIGNPLLLFVVGSNLALKELKKTQPVPENS